MLGDGRWSSSKISCKTGEKHNHETCQCQLAVFTDNDLPAKILYEATVLHLHWPGSWYSRTGKQRGEPAYSCPRALILPISTVIISFEVTEEEATSSLSIMFSQMVSTKARSQWPEQWMMASLHSHRLKGSQNSSYSWQQKNTHTHITCYCYP